VPELPAKPFEYSAVVRVFNEYGLHARPAALLAAEARKYASRLSLVHGDMEVDAKSVLDILTLAAPKGVSLTLRGQGKDAEQAVKGLSGLFAARFAEER
jgi:phosphocarrier protein